MRQTCIAYSVLSFRYRSKSNKNDLRKFKAEFFGGRGREKSLRLHKKDTAFAMSLEGCIQCEAFNNVQWTMWGQKVHSKQQVFKIDTPRVQPNLAGQSADV